MSLGRGPAWAAAWACPTWPGSMVTGPAAAAQPRGPACTGRRQSTYLFWLIFSFICSSYFCSYFLCPARGGAAAWLGRRRLAAAGGPRFILFSYFWSYFFYIFGHIFSYFWSHFAGLAPPAWPARLGWLGSQKSLKTLSKTSFLGFQPPGQNRQAEKN